MAPMIRARVSTPWQTTDDFGPSPCRRPLIWMRYSVHGTDVTRQPAENLLPEPNLVTVEIVCDEATFATIAADNDFLVLWSEETTDA